MDATIQEKIRIVMIKRGGISAAELARKLQAAGQNISPQVLASRLKSGRFSGAELEAIAAALGCTVRIPPPPVPVFVLPDNGGEI